MGAFEKMLSAPEIADKNFEVTLYALGHNGWDESTHMVSFYFKSAERYLEAGQTFAASPAFQEFMKAGAAVGVENQAQTLTTHSIVAGDGRGTRSMVNWTVKVSDPERLCLLGKSSRRPRSLILGPQKPMACKRYSSGTMVGRPIRYGRLLIHRLRP